MMMSNARRLTALGCNNITTTSARTVRSRIRWISTTAPSTQQAGSGVEYWKQVKNPQGRMYFINLNTLERTWIEPVASAAGPVKVFGYKEDVDLGKNKNVEIVDPKDAGKWKFGERVYQELVRSQTWYWVAFAGASGYLGYIVFFKPAS